MNIQESIGYLLAQAAKEHRSRVSTAFSDLGIHVGQDMVLLCLWKEDGLTPSELASRLKVEPGTVSKVLSRMEKVDLVTRRSDPEDARSYKVYLTERGRALREPVESRWQEVEDRMVEELSPEEKVVLYRLLSRVRNNLSTSINVHPP
ncbi:MAG: MarR family transcriptional regulator [Rubrobacteraceae bacterium]